MNGNDDVDVQAFERIVGQSLRFKNHNSPFMPFQSITTTTRCVFSTTVYNPPSIHHMRKQKQQIQIRPNKNPMHFPLALTRKKSRRKIRAFAGGFHPRIAIRCWQKSRKAYRLLLLLQSSTLGRKSAKNLWQFFAQTKKFIYHIKEM